MKIQDQSIPAELQALYDSLISNDPAGGSGELTARTRRAARYKKEWSRYIDSHWLPAALWIANCQDLTQGTAVFQKQVRDRIREMRMGVFDPDYWTELPILDEEYFQSAATGPEETAPPPYAYRNSNFKPQQVTYSDGIPGYSPTRSSGAVIATQWTESNWTWASLKFALVRPATPANHLPIAFTCNGQVTVAASDRGSRPMFSLLVKPLICASWLNPASELSPPIENAISLYYRYRLPVTTPPYFHSQNARYGSVAISKSYAAAEAEEQDILRVKFAIRPMFGLGFNNNTSVQNSFEGATRAYQLNPCAGVA